MTIYGNESIEKAQIFALRRKQFNNKSSIQYSRKSLKKLKNFFFIIFKTIYIFHFKLNSFFCLFEIVITDHSSLSKDVDRVDICCPY